MGQDKLQARRNFCLGPNLTKSSLQIKLRALKIVRFLALFTGELNSASVARSSINQHLAFYSTREYLLNSANVQVSKKTHIDDAGRHFNQIYTATKI